VNFVDQVRETANQLGISNPEYSLTGHSLGAALAEILGAVYKIPATTFESPGTRPMIQDLIDSGVLPADALAYADAHTVTYNAAPNAINTCNEHVGVINRVYPPIDLLSTYDMSSLTPISPRSYLWYTVQQHSMSGILSQLDPVTGMPIRYDRQYNWPSNSFLAICVSLPTIAMAITGINTSQRPSSRCCREFRPSSRCYREFIQAYAVFKQIQQSIIFLNQGSNRVSLLVRKWLRYKNTWGDPHLVTFNNVRYDFQKPGEYDLVVSEDGLLRVQVRQQLMPGSNAISLNVAVATRINNTLIEFRLPPQGSRQVGELNTNGTMYGTANPDVIIGNGGYKEMFGYGGNDQLYCGSQYSTSDVSIVSHCISHGGAGHDSIFGGFSSDDNNVLNGDSGDDYIEARSGTNVIAGGPDSGKIEFRSAGTITPISSLMSFFPPHTYGYYVKDGAGNPLRGFIIWANVNRVTQETTYSLGLDVSLDNIGFFLIPNGYFYNPGLSDGDQVSFIQINGVWAVVKQSTVLNSTYFNNRPPTYAFYSDVRFNSDNISHMNLENGNQCWSDIFGRPPEWYASCYGAKMFLADTSLLTTGDTIVCGSGHDIINYALGSDGVDLVQNFDVTQDEIVIANCSASSVNMQLTSLNGGVLINFALSNSSSSTGGLFVEGVTDTALVGTRIAFVACRTNTNQHGNDDDPNDVLFINGTGSKMQNNELRFVSDGMVISTDNNEYYVFTNNGSGIQVTINSNYIDVTAFVSLNTKTHGLLGTNDNDSTNDLELRDGTKLPDPITSTMLYDVYASSWHVDQSHSLFTYNTAANESTHSFDSDLFNSAHHASLSDYSAEAVKLAQQQAVASGYNPNSPIFDDITLEILAGGIDVNSAQKQLTDDNNNNNVTSVTTRIAVLVPNDTTTTITTQVQHTTQLQETTQTAIVDLPRVSTHASNTAHVTKSLRNSVVVVMLCTIIFRLLF
jgi:hypothetical protein